MKTRINILALIMAAGNSTRFKGIKQVADITGAANIPVPKSADHHLDHYPDQSTLSLVKHSFLQHEAANFNQVKLVLGANLAAVRAVIPPSAQCIEAKDWHLGLGHSIANAIEQVSDDITHVYIGLADQVALNTEHFNLMLKHANENPKCIISARYNRHEGLEDSGVNSTEHCDGQRKIRPKQHLGAPCIFPAAYFPDLSKLTGDKGARDLLRHLQSNHPSRIKAIDLPRAAIDIDTQDDLQRFVHSTQSKRIIA